MVAGPAYGYDAFFKCTNDEQGPDADTLQAREEAYGRKVEALEKYRQKPELRALAVIAAINAEYDLAFDTILLAEQRGAQTADTAFWAEHHDQLMNESLASESVMTREDTVDELRILARKHLTDDVLEAERGILTTGQANELRWQAREHRDMAFRESGLGDYLEVIEAITQRYDEQIDEIARYDRQHIIYQPGEAARRREWHLEQRDLQTMRLFKVDEALAAAIAT